MPELKRVQCSHSGKPEGKICLLGVVRQCLIPSGKGGEPSIWYSVVKSFSRTPRQFNLRKGQAEKEPTDPDVKPIKNLGMNQISFGILEVILVIFVTVLFMALVSSLIQLQDSIRNVFLQMFSSVLLTTVCGFAFITAYMFAYKYLLLMEMKQQTKMQSRNEKIFLIAIRGFYGLTLAMAIVFSTFVIIIRGSDEWFIIYQWIAVLVFSSALIGLVWNLYSHWQHLFPSKTWEEPSSLTVNSASVNEPFV